MAELFADQRAAIEREQFCRVTGRVVEVTGLTVVAEGLALPVGSFYEIRRRHEAPIAAQAVSLRGDRQILMTLHDPLGVGVGDPVVNTSSLQRVAVGRQMLGCVLNGLGHPIGERTEFPVEAHYPVYANAPPPLSRDPIKRALPTGIRAIDAMHTLGGGQRLGIFAGTGVGKSVLLGMIARYTAADVAVVALIGERGREVGDFIRKDLKKDGLKRTVLVVSTSDESPVLRVRAAFVATAVAEYFRDQGKDVLLMMDSTTRIAMAQREIGLAAGEPPTTKGYPPSVFGLLPKLLERSGRTTRGSITGLYTVLVEGDDITDPISDAVRGVLDGHVWLARELANRAHYPAVDVLEGVSRIMPDVVSEEHMRAAAMVRRVLAVFRDIEDLVNIGAYTPGTNVEFDVAVQMKPVIDEFLQQGVRDCADWTSTVDGVIGLADQIDGLRVKFDAQRATATATAE
ncbi:MAG: FliI/YscN family ATPase [Planctomycetes bacterium]|nr:FliI/YscN family ATPase [Planctomycetota bacterium]